MFLTYDGRKSATNQQEKVGFLSNGMLGPLTFLRVNACLLPFSNLPNARARKLPPLDLGACANPSRKIGEKFE